MIAINLIPDIKAEMLRARKMRNTAIASSIIVGVVAMAIVAAMGLVMWGQIGVEASTNKTIDQEYKKFTDTEGAGDMLTLQNQLSEISQLNSAKTMDSRLFDVLSAINPPSPDDMKFSKITLDPTQSSLMIEGISNGGFASAEVFRKTILNTMVEGKDASGGDVSVALATDVSLKDVNYGVDANGATVLHFTVAFAYPEGLFDNSLSAVKIKTPTSRVDVTDSKTRVPDSLFAPMIDQTGGN